MWFDFATIVNEAEKPFSRDGFGKPVRKK